MSDDRPDEHELDTDTNENDIPAISNAWIWIILALLALIVLFFVFGGDKLLDSQGTDMTPKTSSAPSK